MKMLSAIIIRCISTTGVRTYARGGRRFDRTAQNPGVKHRVKAFEDGGIDIPPDADLDQLLEESEADMQNVHHAYNRYVAESEKERENLRKQIVHDKYFDEAMPNLLTWSEKEQIRYLATERADEWTPERIAESFPVTPETVRKLVKYPWRPSSMKRIERHDASALRNWKQLKDGELDIPENLRKRFLKFSDRKIPPLKESCIKPEIPTEIVGEFQAIIEKSAAKQREKELLESKKEEENKVIVKDESIEQALAQKSKSVQTKKDSKMYTLDELKYNINKKISAGKEVGDIEHYIVSSPELKDDEITSVEENSLEPVTKIHKDMTVFQEDKNVNEPVKILNRIRIPKAAYKKGRTYRVNDCYYDYDGHFLYRVPGISSTSGVN